MLSSRRNFLGFAALLPWLPACNVGASTLARKLEGLPTQPISLEEIALLENPQARPAWFSQHNLPQGQPLEIRQRILGGERRLLRDADLKDVRFINCSFEGFQGYGNNLENVQFEECQFLGGVFTGALWKNVKFLRSEAEGPFQIGCANGDVLFEECKLQGMTVKEGGYGNWADHFGLATGQGGSATFINCRLANLQTGGAHFLKLLRCQLEDVYANSQSQQGQLIIEECTSPQTSRQDFGGGGNNFSRIAIRNSKLGLVDLMSVTADEFEIVGSSLSLKTGAFSGRIGKATFRDTRFFGKGLYCPLVPHIDSWLIENCTFNSSGLHLFGKPNKQPPTPERGPIYWTRIRELTLRNQTLAKANMAYMQVGTFVVENSTLTDCNLANGRFGTWRFVNAKLSGSLDLAGTTIRAIENQGLAQNARLNGKLEASLDATEPDV